MNEIIKDVAWPASFLIFALAALCMFRSKLSSLIDRTRGGKAGGFSLDLDPAQPPVQTVAIESLQTTRNTTSAARTQSELTMSDDVLREFESPAVIEIEDNIHAELEKRKLLPAPNARDGAFKLLSRALAKVILHSQYDAIYGVIFGSQINLLVHINGQNNIGEAEKAIREYYLRKQSEFEKLKDYSFDSYINYLTSAVLLKKEGDIYKITVKGRDFLQYIAASGKSFTKDL